MGYWIIRIICLASLFMVVGNVQAEERTYKVALVGVPGFLESTEHGAGAKLYQKLASRLSRKGIKLQSTYFQAAKRAAVAFQQGEYDVLFPAGLGDPNIQGIPSAAVVGERFVLFTNKLHPRLNAIQDLEGKTVGSPRGYFVPQYIAENPRIKVLEGNSMNSVFLMLSRGRLDSVMALETAGEQILRNTGLTNIVHGEAVDFAFGVFMFHENPEGRKLLIAVNHEFAAMIKDGSYKRVMQGSAHSLM